MAIVWKTFKECRAFKVKHSKVRMNRWFAWFDRMDTLKLEWYSTYFVLAYICLCYNLYNAVRELPMFGFSPRAHVSNFL